MTDHPITPPPELTDVWKNLPLSDEEIFVIAARWGADQELEACCKLLELSDSNAREFLHSARRPKPPSLKEQALHALLHIDQGQHNERCHIIRRALNQLPDE